MLKGLRDMHEKELVHHDIKPANIMRTFINGKMVVKLVDLGMVTSEKDGVSGGTDDYNDYLKIKCMHLFDSGKRVYAREIDKRTDHFKSDLWALAVSVYELEARFKKNVFDFKINYKNYEEKIPIVKELITDASWANKRGINLCNEDSKICFHDAIVLMMEDRDSSTIKTQTLVDMLQAILNHQLRLHPKALDNLELIDQAVTQKNPLFDQNENDESQQEDFSGSGSTNLLPGKKVVPARLARK